MTPEGKVEDYLIKRVTQTGGEVRKVAWVGRRGAPDRMIWWPGPVFSFVEVKAAGGKLSVLQKLELGRLQNAGFNVGVVYNEDDVDSLIMALTPVAGYA